MILKLTSLALTFKFIYSLTAFHASGTVTGTWVDTVNRKHKYINYTVTLIIISSYQNDTNQFTNSLDFHISLPCLSWLQPIMTREMRQEWSRQHRGTEVRYVRQGDQSTGAECKEERVAGRSGLTGDHRSLTTCYGSERNEAGQGAVQENDASRLSALMCLQVEKRRRREEGIS